MIGETGERKSAVATPDGKSRKKKYTSMDVRWKLKLNTNKTVYTIFSRRYKVVATPVEVAVDRSFSKYISYETRGRTDATL